MQEDIKKRIEDLEFTLKQWSDFEVDFSKLTEEKILEEAKVGSLAAWSGKETYFTPDKDAMNAIDRIVVENSGIAPVPEICVRNSELQKGKKACLKFIKTEIRHKAASIKAFKLNLK
jgi:hypothetical protein